MITSATRTPRPLAWLALLPALVLAACGGGTATHPSGTATHAAGTATRPSGGTTTRPKGTTTRPKGTTTHPKGTTTHPSGTAKSSTHSTPQHLAPIRALPAAQRAAYCAHGQASCVTQSTALKAVGSPLIDLNLEQAMALNQPKIKHPKVTCPSSTGYPVHCTVTGSERLNGKRVPITGTVTVIGISTINQTYAYEALYRPGHSG